MISDSSLHLPERCYSSKPRPRTLGTGDLLRPQAWPPYGPPWRPCARRRCTRSARNATCRGPCTRRNLSSPASRCPAHPPRNGAPGSPPFAGPCTVPESYLAPLDLAVGKHDTNPPGIIPIVCMYRRYRFYLYLRYQASGGLAGVRGEDVSPKEGGQPGESRCWFWDA